MTELLVTEDELKLVETYRAMDADVKEFALIMFNQLKTNGKFFAKLELMSNNRVGDNSNFAIGGSIYFTKREDIDNGID